MKYELKYEMKPNIIRLCHRSINTTTTTNTAWLKDGWMNEWID